MTLQGWQHAVTAIGTTWVSRDVGELLLMVFHGTLLASEALTRCMASGAAWASCGAKTTRGLVCDGRVQRRPCSVREPSRRIWTRSSAKTWIQACARFLVWAVLFA
jgi:hypothetical protein